MNSDQRMDGAKSPKFVTGSARIDVPGAQGQQDWRESCSSIREKLFQSLLTGSFADVKFIVGQHHRKEILAHKYILLLNSSVFENLIGANAPKKSIITVNISEVEPEALSSFLKFIYTDEFEVDPKDATAVLYLAKKYGVTKLVYHSGEFIKGIISKKNVVTILLSAEALGETSISSQARRFLKQNISQVIHEADFLQLNNEELCQIFASDELNVSELELFNAAIHWADEECHRQKLDKTPHNYRLVLKNVLYLIRFPLMDTKEFTFSVATKGILTDSECLNILMHFNASNQERVNLPPMLFSNKPRREPMISNAMSEQANVTIPTHIMMSSDGGKEIYDQYYYGQKRGPPPPRRIVSAQQPMMKIPPGANLQKVSPASWNMRTQAVPVLPMTRGGYTEYAAF